MRSTAMQLSVRRELQAALWKQQWVRRDLLALSPGSACQPLCLAQPISSGMVPLTSPSAPFDAPTAFMTVSSTFAG